MIDDCTRRKCYHRTFCASPPSPTTSLSRQPTYDNLAKLAKNREVLIRKPPMPIVIANETPRLRLRKPSFDRESSLHSSSSTETTKMDDCNKMRATNRPQVRAPLIDFHNATKASLGKVVGARTGWQPIIKPPVEQKPKIPKPKSVTPDGSSGDNNRSSSSKSDDKPTRLCSHRLRPARSVFDEFALSVLKTGTVVLEKLAPVSELGDNKPTIREIIQVSADGEAITSAKLRQPIAFDTNRPVTIDKLVRGSLGGRQLCSSIDMRTFSYDTMPSHLYGRYRCAANYVNILRAKTPKVTINKIIKGIQVNCSLMESVLDCTVSFTPTNPPPSFTDDDHFVQQRQQPLVVVSFSPDRTVRIQSGGTTITLSEGPSLSEDRFQLPKTINEKLTIALGMRAVAVSIEKSVSSSQPGIVHFPIECGQRRAAF